MSPQASAGPNDERFPAPPSGERAAAAGSDAGCTGRGVTGAFERLTRRIAALDESGWRLARFAPPPTLPLAEVHLPAAGQRVRGEVLDLGFGGIRLAIDHGIPVSPGDPCRVVVTLGSAESHVLQGRVRRIQDHQMIMVFVVTPDDSGSGAAPGHEPQPGRSAGDGLRDS